MRMLKMKYILFAAFLLSAAGVSAQKAERDYIRKGNRLFNDSVFVDAEVNYRKALEVNPKSAVSMYNLGNTLSQQQKFQEAMEQYDSASKIEKDKMKLAHIYHNMGGLFQAGKDYAKAVDAYKMSLRNNPADHETRYNLALAQKMLKDQQNQQDQDQNQDQNKDQQQKQDQKHSKIEIFEPEQIALILYPLKDRFKIRDAGEYRRYETDCTDPCVIYLLHSSDAPLNARSRVHIVLEIFIQCIDRP